MLMLFLFAGDFNFQFSSSRHDFFLNSLKQHKICSADNRYLKQDSFTKVRGGDQCLLGDSITEVK